MCEAEQWFLKTLMGMDDFTFRRVEDGKVVFDRGNQRLTFRSWEVVKQFVILRGLGLPVEKYLTIG